MRQKKNGLENLVLITQLGLNVVTPVLLCVALGVWIDRKTGLSATLIFLILGILSGALNAYKTAKGLIEREKREREKEKNEQIKRWEERFGDSDGVSEERVKRQ